MAPLEPSFPVLSPAEQALFPDLLITTAASAPTPLKIR